MHHTFINGRYVPQDFRLAYPDELSVHFDTILRTPLEYVLHNYEKPFKVAFHARVRIRNIRLRKNTCFDKWGIALEPSSKFKKGIEPGVEFGFDPANVMQENAVRKEGWYDRFECATFAFGKLYKAEEIVIHINELELWTMSRVYEWDSIEPIFGEVSMSFKLPPDFVTLQSNKLFEQKSAAKFISFHYHKGESYKYDLKGIPDGIANMLRKGTCEPQFFEAWYSSTVKGMFNGIYGTQAQDVFKPSYKCVDGNLSVDEETVTTPENYDEKKPRSCRVLYTYGMRIVGGSRMHMVIAMELLYKNLQNRAWVLGGDTDSMKIACDSDVTDEEISCALEPIANASTQAIHKCMFRLRKNFPDLASGLNGIGGFEIENANNHYELHIELWNKCRVSIDMGNGVHITCAGLPRPAERYHIERFIAEFVDAGYEAEQVLRMCVGYNTFVCNSICHMLESHRPRVTDRIQQEISDYCGNTCFVDAHEVTCLYPTGRWLGETLKRDNAATVSYLKEQYNRDVDTNTYRLMVDGATIEICKETEIGLQTVALGESKWILEHTQSGQ
jgi:hypothetical protein